METKRNHLLKKYLVNLVHISSYDLTDLTSNWIYGKLCAHSVENMKWKLLSNLFLENISWNQRIYYCTKEVKRNNTKKMYLLKKLPNQNYHYITYVIWSTLWKLRNFTATVFSQKLRQIKALLKNFCKLIWRKKFCGAVNFSFFHIILCALFRGFHF